ncbi:MAG: sulfatase-like hydrolase/transferase [Solirubrobacterales bacterium]|nr:sulfatase-like hydrolase/transferase [Solirubrobacterales bacterium]
MSISRPIALALLVVVLLLAGAALLLRSDRPASSSQRDRPDIVVIQTDDQSLASLGGATMPNVIELAKNGTTFTEAIATTSLCCPSRASLLTGQYAHNHGVLNNRPGYAKLRGPENVLPAWLQRAGYRTVHLGKFLNGYEDVGEARRSAAPGWDDWLLALAPRAYNGYKLADVEGHEQRKGGRPRDYATKVFNRRAEQVIRRHAAEPAPLYLQVDHYAPHNGSGDPRSGCTGNSAVPARRDAYAFNHRPLPHPRSFDEDDVSDKPPFMSTVSRIDPAERHQLRRDYRCDLASLRSVDRGVGGIVDAVRDTGRLDRTVFVFISDNGYSYGEHRLVEGKGLAYEESIRVPMVIAAPPGLLEADSPRRNDDPVANIDLAPTILDLAGAAPCLDAERCRMLDGRSLVPLLRGERPAWSRDRALAVEFTAGGRINAVPKAGQSCEYHGVRTTSEMLVVHTRAPRRGETRCRREPQIEQYDLERDPRQLENLADRSGDRVRERRSELLERARALATCAGTSSAAEDPCE